MTDEEYAAKIEEVKRLFAEISETLAREIAPTVRLFLRLWRRITRWIQVQGILSPAYAYASPAMRRRAAQQRARLAMQAKNRRQ